MPGATPSTGSSVSFPEIMERNDCSGRSGLARGNEQVGQDRIVNRESEIVIGVGGPRLSKALENIIAEKHTSAKK